MAGKKEKGKEIATTASKELAPISEKDTMPPDDGFETTVTTHDDGSRTMISTHKDGITVETRNTLKVEPQVSDFFLIKFGR